MSPCHPEAGYFRIKSQRLTVQKSVTYGAKVSHLRRKSQSLTTQKSVTYDAKVSHLRPVIPWLTNRNPIIKPLKIKQARHLEVIPSKSCKRAYKHQSKENLWKSMSNCEQVWATVSCLLTDFVSLHCDSEILSGSNQQAIVRRPHSKIFEDYANIGKKATSIHTILKLLQHIKQVKADVMPFIKNPKEMTIWSNEYFLQLAKMINFE